MKIKDKINYIQGGGDFVRFDFDGKTKGTGKICGKTIENEITVWIIEILTGNIDKKIYPYSYVPHCLLEKMED